MSLLTSLYTGASGLETSSQDLSVIGDNIANANTIGFKQSRAAFEDQLSQTLIGDVGTSQEGLGARVQAVRTIVSQGSLTSTGVATDLALQGNGYFVVKGTHNGVDGSFFTRAGQFSIDKSGYLANLDGLHVQGYTADVNGTIGGGLSDLALGAATSQPKATNNIALKGNLQADAVVPPAWDPAAPETTSNFSTSETAYDSLGSAHQIQVYFRKTGAGAWEFHAMTDGAGIQGGTAGTPSEVAAGTLAFDATGKLSAQTQTGSFNPIGATQPQTLNLNFGDATGVAGGTGLAGMTQFASASATSYLSQDGAAAGVLNGVQVQSDGRVVGSFSNGQSRVLAQVAIANFQAPDQLQRAGGNVFAQTVNSGDPSIGAAGTGGRGSITAGALEQSNVDLAGEFVHMIAAQREFQANSKTVQTADSLLQELIQLKR